MAYRIYDENVLDTVGEFQLTLDISSAYPVKNPDGTSPVLTAKVEAPTKRDAIQTLAKLGEDKASGFLEVALDHCIITGDFNQELPLEELLKDEAFVKRFQDTSNGFFDIVVEAVLSDEGGEKAEFKMTVSTPSYDIAYNAMAILTSNEKLNQVVVTFMPLVSDENEDWDDDYDDYWGDDD